MECGVVGIRIAPLTWTMRKEDVKRLEAFEIWIWRRMERISWMEHMTNEVILQMVDEKESLIGTIRGGDLAPSLGGGKLFRGPRFLNDGLFGQRLHFSRPKFLMTFLVID